MGAIRGTRHPGRSTWDPSSETRDQGPIHGTRDPGPLHGTWDLGPFNWDPVIFSDWFLYDWTSWDHLLHVLDQVRGVMRTFKTPIVVLLTKVV